MNQLGQSLNQLNIQQPNADQSPIEQEMHQYEQFCDVFYGSKSAPQQVSNFEISSQTRFSFSFLFRELRPTKISRASMAIRKIYPSSNSSSRTQRAPMSSSWERQRSRLCSRTAGSRSPRTKKSQLKNISLAI
jgi:hypothetical protein